MMARFEEMTWAAVMLVALAACTQTNATQSGPCVAIAGKPEAATGSGAGTRPVFRGAVPIVRGLMRDAGGTFVVLEVQVQNPRTQAVEFTGKQFKAGDSFEWGGGVYVVKGVMLEERVVQLEQDGKTMTIPPGYTIMNQPMTMASEQPEMRRVPNAPVRPRDVPTPGTGM